MIFHWFRSSIWRPIKLIGGWQQRERQRVDFLCVTVTPPSQVLCFTGEGCLWHLDWLVFSLFVNRLARRRLSNHDFISRSPRMGLMWGGTSEAEMHFGTVYFTRWSTKTQPVLGCRLGVVLKAPIGQARAQHLSQDFFLPSLWRMVNSDNVGPQNAYCPGFIPIVSLIMNRQHNSQHRVCLYQPVSSLHAMNPSLCLMTVYYSPPLKLTQQSPSLILLQTLII